jgi:hypothetical protein
MPVPAGIGLALGGGALFRLRAGRPVALAAAEQAQPEQPPPVVAS